MESISSGDLEEEEAARADKDKEEGPERAPPPRIAEGTMFIVARRRGTRLVNIH